MCVLLLRGCLGNLGEAAVSKPLWSDMLGDIDLCLYLVTAIVHAVRREVDESHGWVVVAASLSCALHLAPRPLCSALRGRTSPDIYRRGPPF